jgi:SAM-dependent methyltransferase
MFETIKKIILESSNKDSIVEQLQENKLEIENYFVSLTGDEIDNSKYELHNICIDFINSNIFQSNKDEPEFIGIITLFAELFETINFFGAISVIKSNLPSDSSIKHRLDAAFKYSKVRHPEDYIDRFEQILTSLKKAQDFGDLDYTGQVVQDLISYYLIGKKDFEDSKSEEKLNNFKSLFISTESRTKYKFLTHPTFKDYLDGYNPDKIYVDSIEDKIYLLSSVMQRVFRELILDKVYKTGFLDRYTGDVIRADILKYGRADFTTGHEDLTAYDKVLLYCFFNMRKHYFTSYAVYEKIYSYLKEHIFTKKKKVLFIDMGCGCLTSGLAFASLYFDKEQEYVEMDYVGIDISESMLEKAQEFEKSEIFNSSCTFNYYKDWNVAKSAILNEHDLKSSVIIFNASYLFASESLDEKNISTFVAEIALQSKEGSYFVFQNPDRVDRNVKYFEFKKHIEHDVVESETKIVRYRTNANLQYEASSEAVNYEILSL